VCGGFLSDIPVIDLYEDAWVRIVADGNTRVGEQLPDCASSAAHGPSYP
jgi:hypothetical protein